MSSRSESAKLLRRQLDERFNLIREAPLQSPRGGWIKTIREALGMTATQLAKRLGISLAGLSKIEASERKGTITLSTLKKAADVLGCRVAVSLIPLEPLEETVKKRAREVANRISQRSQLHMQLEDQGLSGRFQAAQAEDSYEELMGKLAEKLWEEP